MDFFNLAENQYQKKLPFVLYRKPGVDHVNAIFQANQTLNVVQDFTETGFVFAPYNSKQDVILLHPDEFLEHKVPVQHVLQHTEIATEHRDTGAKENYVNMVEKAINAIKSGDLKKVVLSRELLRFGNYHPFELFKRILGTYRSAFCYLWYHPKVGMWLGATPELLLKTSGNRMVTMSLAGTKVADNHQPPVWSKKEWEEQQLVTDYVVSVLQNKVGKLSIASVESILAGNLWHLRTEVSGTYNQSELASIITALHPTPAVCGMPLQSAIKFIIDHENYNRNFYTGYLGELNFQTMAYRSKMAKNIENKAYKVVRKTTELYVNLRCMALDNDSATIYVGGGITSGSDAEKEWEETVNKSQTMLRILT